jgi:uncharacterized membrane protein
MLISRKLSKISLMFFLSIVCFLPLHLTYAQTDNPEIPPRIQDEFFRARVLNVQEETLHEEYGQKMWWQYLNVKFLNGSEKGKEMLLLYEMDVHVSSTIAVKEGSIVIVGKNSIPPITYYISDRYRLGNVGIILAIFVFVAVIFTKFQGIRAFLGLGFSFFLIFYFVLPQILLGKNPFLLCILAAFVIATLSIFIAHGFNRRTNIAVVSTLLTLGLSAILGYFFVKGVHLIGLGSEEAFYLRGAIDGGIDLKGLLLGGILIGTLGILDDITTAQAAAVEEIQKAHMGFGFRELYNRGLSVGREHIVSLINTLVLAYTGTSFPLLLLFLLNDTPAWITLNSEIVVEELIRMLVGSIALIFAVPITTALAAYFFRKKDLKNIL